MHETAMESVLRGLRVFVAVPVSRSPCSPSLAVVQHAQQVARHPAHLRKTPRGSVRCIRTTPPTSRAKCPRCGMALVRAAPFDVRDYQLDFRTVPSVVRPGQKTTLRFRIFHPGTGEPIKKFESGPREAVPPLRHQPGHGVLPAHPPGGAGRRHVDDRGDAAESRLLQGALRLSPERRLIPVHRAAARHRRVRRQISPPTARISCRTPSSPSRWTT